MNEAQVLDNLRDAAALLAGPGKRRGFITVDKDTVRIDVYDETSAGVRVGCTRIVRWDVLLNATSPYLIKYEVEMALAQVEREVRRNDQ